MILESLKSLSVPIASVNPDPANARRHPERNLDAIVASLSRFGQRAPIVVQKQGMIVRAGNGRLEAAKKLGWTHIAAVIVDENSVDATAFAIADNRTSDLAEWDDKTLASLLDTLPAELRDAAGYSENELGSLLDSLRPPITEDSTPEPLPEPVSRMGDLWECGEHRILCGDSTKVEDVERVMDGAKASLVLTDPPYGVSYEGKTKDALEISNDDEAGLEPLLRSALGHAASVCKPGAVWYVAAPPGPQFLAFARVLTDLGIWRQTLAWVKDSMVLGHSDFHYKHEAVFYGWVPGKHRPPPTRTYTSVLEFARPKASLEHPTMKPVELWSFLMAASTAKGATVYEPFSGSGATIIAAERLGQRCCAIELEPRYVDVAVRRWQNLTGKAATLNGKTFAAVSAERGVSCS